MSFVRDSALRGAPEFADNCFEAFTANGKAEGGHWAGEDIDFVLNPVAECWRRA